MRLHLLTLLSLVARQGDAVNSGQARNTNLIPDVPETLKISSTGPAKHVVGHLFGLYSLVAGQRAWRREDGAWVLYRNTEDYWCVGKDNDNAGYFICTVEPGYPEVPPKTGWKFWNKDHWKNDDLLTIDDRAPSPSKTPTQKDNGKVPGYGLSVSAASVVELDVLSANTDPDVPGALLVSSPGPSGTVQLGAMGLYKLTTDKVNDHRTWQNIEDFIYWRGGYWCIGESYQATADHMCTANPENSESPTKPAWLFINQDLKWEYDADLKVHQI